MKRAHAACWPRIFLPEPGCRPLSIEPRRDERILHVCLRVPGDPQSALAAALRGMAEDYAEVDWYEVQKRNQSVSEACVQACERLRPTLIFMQIQTAGVLSGDDVRRLRPFCAPDCVIVQWDGDQHHPPNAPQREWFRTLGRACDVSLICNTEYPHDYDEMGIRCGYLQIGVDTDLWQPTTPDPTGPDIVLLASNYAHIQSYSRRVAAARMLTSRFPNHFAAYGYGWELDGQVNGRKFVAHEKEAPLYSRALASVSISIRNDLPRYTSDRLYRCLAAGALTLVEQYPDMGGEGLRHGENCLVWSTLGELESSVSHIVARPEAVEWLTIRRGARELALTHSWQARMGELAAIVEAIRDEGRL